MAGNGNIVATGTLNMRSSSNVSSNGVFEVFGIPTGSNLASLVNRNYDPRDAVVRFTACNVPALPLSLSFFRGLALYASAITPAVTNLSATTLTPNFSGSTGTYYVAIGTTLGGTNAQTTAWKALTNGTTALTLIPSLTTGSTYYISGYGSNANGTRTLAVSNTATFIPLATSSVTANTISNTTFTVTATLPSGASSNEYKLYTQAGALQSTNTTGTFTGLTPNTQYYATVQAKTAYTASAVVQSASIWCLAPVTFDAFPWSVGYYGSALYWTNISTSSTGVTSIVCTLSNENGSVTSSDRASTTNYVTVTNYWQNRSTYVPTWNTTSNAFWCGSSLTSLIVITKGTNTTYSNVVKMFKQGYPTEVCSITPSSTLTINYVAKGADGGAATYDALYLAGAGARLASSCVIPANTTFSIYIGESAAYATVGSSTSNSKCGDGTYGCSGGSAWNVSPYGSGLGGAAGAGGAATVVVANGSFVAICGGGGGVGAGNNDAGGQYTLGGNAGNGSCSAGGYIPGGEGNTQRYSSNAYGHQGGWGGSETISNRNNDWGNPDPTTSWAPGAGGGGYRGTVYYVTNLAYGSNGTNWTGASGGGNGGNGVQYYGTASGGGGGGYGGGGSGVAMNQGSTGSAGAGGGGASWSSTACTFTVGRTAEPGVGFICY